MTLDELIVKGNAEYDVQGLNSFSADDGAKEVKLTGEITPDVLTALYFRLDIETLQHGLFQTKHLRY